MTKVVSKLLLTLAFALTTFGCGAKEGVWHETKSGLPCGGVDGGFEYLLRWRQVKGVHEVELRIEETGSKTYIKDTFSVKPSDYENIFELVDGKTIPTDDYFAKFFEIEPKINGCSLRKVKTSEMPAKPVLFGGPQKPRDMVGKAKKSQVLSKERPVLYYRRAWREELVVLVWVKEMGGFIRLQTEY